ncbi:putative sun protein [Magnetofaba australis IT-1]|uniref:16S rRNA (cytosine(967)-C(5))-methyltransferase n=1 Tax=Magnetofaba australis IT-1 TaxID=1434232 RepID=A0A1Y2JZD6_9PROT|nr:putative sun protein [Magnetofaba australis IT-1]
MALEVLLEFFRQPNALEDRLDALWRAHPDLDPRDRGLIHEIVLGVLRQWPLLDAMLRIPMNKTLPDQQLTAWTALRIGLYQLHWMRVPPHAAIHASVELVKRSPDQPLTGFVNAVLRRAAELTPEQAWESVRDPARRLSVQHAHPLWLTRRWLKQLGEERTAARMAANNAQAPLTLRFHGADDDARAQWLAELAESGVEARPLEYPPEAVLLPQGGRIPALPGYAEGRFAVQDRAAMAAARLVDPQPGERIVDACAAPGGKTAHMAALSGGAATIVALDNRAERLQRVAENLDRLQVQGVEVRVADARNADELGAELYDRALIDAPCSGTGVIRRHPEIKWRRTAKEIAQAAERQGEILRGVASRVKPGGVLVYAVCSMEPEEGPDQIAAFLAENPQWRRDEVEAKGLGLDSAWFNELGELLTEPSEHGVDGFYAARLIRVTDTE